MGDLSQLVGAVRPQQVARAETNTTLHTHAVAADIFGTRRTIEHVEWQGRVLSGKMQQGLMSDTFRAPLSAATYECKDVVVQPVDAHPYRSPQSVHTALLQHFRGKQVVEFGTRNGDGLSCFATVARSAQAIEFEPKYCRRLEKRSQSLRDATGSSFGVQYGRYQEALDSASLRNAEVFTWWFGGNGLDSAALHYLRTTHDAGKVQPDASAIVLFEAGTRDDEVSFNAVRPHASWEKTVPFDEREQCHVKYAIGQRKPWLCNRSNGSYHVLGFRVGSIPLSIRDGDPRAKMDSRTQRSRERAVG